MGGDANRDLQQRASRGDVEALTVLVMGHGREVMGALAGHVDRWSAVDRLHCRVWAMARPELAQGGDLAAELAEHARTQLSEHLVEAGREAIAARDTVRHLLAQTAIDELGAPPTDAGTPASCLAERLAGLPEADRALLDLRYRHELTLATLAAERGMSEPELVSRLCAARAALDWRNVGTSAGDRLMPALTEDWLAGTIDAPSRALLATSLGQDLGRAARFVRQVRIHLLLTAMHLPFGEAQARSIARVACGRGDSGRATVVYGQPPPPRPRAHSSDTARLAHAGRRPAGRPSRVPLLAVALGGGGLLLVALAALALAPDRRGIARPLAAAELTASRPVATSATPEPARSAPQPPGASALRPVQVAPAPAGAAAQALSTPPTSSSATAPVLAPAPAPKPADPKSKPSSIAITSVTLINADTDQPIPGFEALPDEVTLRLSQLPTRHINLRFNAPAAVKMLTFTLPGCSLRASGTERGRPFSLSNDKDDYKPWSPPKGSYLLTVTPYADTETKKRGTVRTWRILVEE